MKEQTFKFSRNSILSSYNYEITDILIITQEFNIVKVTTTIKVYFRDSPN